MTRAFALGLLVVLTVLIGAAPAVAQGEGEPTAEATATTDGPYLGVGVGAGLAVVGTGIGLGLIGYSGLAAIARQPEIGGRTFVYMLIIAALVEGAALFALVICFLMAQ